MGEESPSPIPILSKTNLLRTFFKFYILYDLIIVVTKSITWNSPHQYPIIQ
jgi:hypothetical protein